MTPKRLRLAAATAMPLLFLVLSPTQAQQATTSRVVNTYGLPGGVDTPSAEMLPDGEIAAGIAKSDYGRKINAAVQIMPRVSAVLRYSRVENVVDRRLGFLKDRSADIRFQLLTEQDWRPAVAVGLQDFLGTGVYSGEYVVATKHFGERVTVSAGLGWGRLAGNTRPFPYGTTGGEFKTSNWFTGKMRPFGSVAFQATDKLRLVAEYSNDDYALEVSGGKDKPSSKFNFGATYRLGEAYELSAYSVGGKTFGAQFTFALNMRGGPFPSGREPAAAPIRPRPAPGADPEAWSGAWAADPTAQPAIQKALGDALAKEGQVLESMALSQGRAEVRINNRRYIQHAEAVGRTARLMSRALPATVETFVITSVERGMPTSSVTVRRSDLERLENTEAGQIAAAVALTDAAPRPGDLVRSPGIYPRFEWTVRPYAAVNTFSVSSNLPFRAGLRAEASWEPMAGIVFSGAVQQRLIGQKDDRPPGPLTAPYRVRSDQKLYADADGLTVEKLQLAWYAKPSETVYTRVSAGLLEPMYGGVSAEVLYKPVNANWAVGVEVNHVKKREIDKRFAFQAYEVTTGHVSGYYDFGGGYLAQIDVGRYLAQDVGATLTVSREFANGFKVGAYVTKTNLSAEQFGEGSFDKGVTFSVPVSWALGTPSKRKVSGDLNSLQRDGGARLRVDGRLYDTVRESHSGKLYQGWGKFWR